jgi:hypothetical protein
MSNIIRYNVDTADADAIIEDKKGWLICYDDYLKVKTENERLKKDIKMLKLTFARLSATKLRK